MNIRRFLIIVLSTIWIISCSGNDSGNDQTQDLTGLWRSELNNAIYSIVDNNTFVEVDLCDDEPSYILDRNDQYLSYGTTNMFQIIGASELEYSVEGYSGIKMFKLSNEYEFDSGSVEIENDNFGSININSGVCAYRESDNKFIHINSPYMNSYLSITIFIEHIDASGSVEFDFDYEMRLESPEISNQTVWAYDGTLDIINYTNTHLEVNFEFQDDLGNTYNGSLDVDI